MIENCLSNLFYAYFIREMSENLYKKNNNNNKSLNINENIISVFALFLSSCIGNKVFYIRSQKKNAQLVYEGYIYNKKQTQANGHTTWRCCEMAKNRCRAVCITRNSKLVRARRNHEHPAHWSRFSNRELYSTEHDIDAHGEIFTITQTSDGNKTVLVEF